MFRATPIHTLSCLFLSLASASTIHAEGDPYTLSLDKSVYEPGDPAVLCIEGTPAVPSILFIDTTLGPVDVPGIGTFGVGLSNSLKLVHLPGLPGNGKATLECLLDCDSLALGIPFYIQLLSYDIVEDEFCLSNTVELMYEEAGESCEVSGCTPGYWKNHEETWAPTGLAPDDDWCDTFGAEIDDLCFSLMDALNHNESILLIQTLGAHSVAALLNTLHPGSNYPLSAQDIIDMVADAALSGDKDYQEDVKDLLADLNEMNCPF